MDPNTPVTSPTDLVPDVLDTLEEVKDTSMPPMTSVSMQAMKALTQDSNDPRDGPVIPHPPFISFLATQAWVPKSMVFQELDQPWTFHGIMSEVMKKMDPSC
ncbi:hypothetical protein HMI55_004238 [Coelomomyces lativittatus]|nr:hypothetical protein HMI55_004238 [Coelomomyces lativittatus]